MKNLNEELKRMLELSSYDYKIKSIIKESDDPLQLDEQPRALFRSLMGDVKGVATATKDFKMFGGNVTKAETFLRDAAAGRAAVADLNAFTKDVLRSGNKLRDAQPGLFKGASESYAKNLFNNTKDDIANQFRNASEADRAALLRNAGYPEATINSITREYKVLEGTKGTKTATTGAKDAKTGAKTGAKDAGTGAKDAGTGAKDAGTGAKDAGAGAKDAGTAGIKEAKPPMNKIRETWTKFKDRIKAQVNKKLSWKQLVLWAAGLGITAYVLWWMFKDSGETPPPDTPPTPPEPTPPTPVPPSPKPNYKECTDFPFEFGCINEKISEIQACLDITPQRGYFGPKTLNKLTEELNKRGQTMSVSPITKEVYDYVKTNICGKVPPSTGTTTGTTVTPTPAPTVGPTPAPTATPPPTPTPTPAPTIQPAKPGEFDGMTGVQIYNKLIEDSKKDGGAKFKRRGQSIVLKRDIDLDALKKLDEYFQTAYQMKRQDNPKVTNRYGAKYVWS